MLLLLTALLLTLWFYRANFRDAPLWMLLTYLGIGALVYQDYSSVSTLNDAFPRILKDFITLGMIGFVQTLAVNKRISILTAVVITLLLFAAAHFLEEYLPDEAPGSTASLLVELEEGASPDRLLAYAADHNYTVAPAFAPKLRDETLLDNYYVLDYPGGDEARISREVLSLGARYTEPNETIQVEPFIVGESAGGERRAPALSIDDPEAAQQWAIAALDLDAYYRLLARQRPRKRARIAILDTGVDARHEDLRDNYVSTEARYDNDPQGHGTHCAGIAAGVTNNGIGIGSLAGSGATPFTELTSIKVLNAGGMGTQKSIVAGIIEAVDEGVDVISLSLGGISNQSRQRAYSQAVKYATDHGAIVVAAAGNSNRRAVDYAPANAEGIITVAAVDPLLLRAPFSNRTDGIARALAAPGVDIFSTTPDNNYRAYSGTSMACPFVAGLLGTLRSLDPELTAAEAYELLHDTGRRTNETRVTGRIVQPAAALERLLNR